VDQDTTLEDAERRYSDAIDAANAALDELHYAAEVRQRATVRRALDSAGVSRVEDGLRLLDILGPLDH